MKNKTKRFCRSFIGEVFTTNEGLEIQIIDGGSKGGYCTINFISYNYSKEVSYDALKKRNIKCELFHSVCNTGCMGVGKYSSKNNLKVFNIWNAMLKRCYNTKVLIKQPTYINVKVCNEWLNFQNFAKWYYKFNIDKFDVDKDLLSTLNIYSPNTCSFIPHYINTFISTKQTNNTSGYTGVYFEKEKKKWQSQISINKKRTNLGRFVSIKEAVNTYIDFRKRCAMDLLTMWLNDLKKLNLTKDQQEISDKAINKFKETFILI